MSQNKKDTKVKKVRTFKEMSEAAHRAVETRRKLHPEWGQMKRIQEAERKKRIDAKGN